MYLDKRKRYVLYAVVAIVSIVALVIVIFEEASSSSNSEVKPTPIVTSSYETNGEYQITNSSKDTELINEFNNLFSEKLLTDGTDIKPYIYPGEDGKAKELITAGQGLTNINWNKATVDLTLPDLHVGNANEESKEFGDFFQIYINGKMINDAREKIKKDDTIVSYSGTYGAYVRTVKNSSSKEEIPVFSYMVKTQMYSTRNGENDEIYSIVYDLENERKLSLKDILDIYGIDWHKIRDAIKSCIDEANKNIDENIYKRENDEMFYSIMENYNKYIINKEGDIYIYFCYGNKDNFVTNAIDVIKITNNNYNKNSIKNSSDDSIGSSDYNRTESIENVVDDNYENNDNNNELVENGNTVQNSLTENSTVENGQVEQDTTENVQETQESRENTGTGTTE